MLLRMLAPFRAQSFHRSSNSFGYALWIDTSTGRKAEAWKGQSVLEAFHVSREAQHTCSLSQNCSGKPLGSGLRNDTGTEGYGKGSDARKLRSAKKFSATFSFPLLACSFTEGVGGHAEKRGYARKKTDSCGDGEKDRWKDGRKGLEGFVFHIFAPVFTVS